MLLLDKVHTSEIKEEPIAALSEKRLTMPSERAIYIQNEDMLARCYKFSILPVVFPTKREPKFALAVANSTGILGDNTTQLGWYKEKEDAQKEIAAIAEAVKSGKRTYQLQYCCKVKGTFSPKIVE